MELLLSFVNQKFTPEYKLGLMASNGNFYWVKGEIANLSNGITGISARNNKLYVSLQQNGLGVLDESFNLIQHVLSENIKDPHSLYIHDNTLYVLSTGKNSIFTYSIQKDGLLKNENLYWKVPWSSNEFDSVHLNSFIITDKGKFVTIFGDRTKGQDWTEIDEGKLIEIDSNFTILDNLKHPHSLCQLDDKNFIFCESRTGQIKDQNGLVLKQFNGYIRGLVKYQNRIIVCENARRKLSKSRIGNLKGRIREFEDEGVSNSKIYFLSAKNYRILKEISLSDYGNEVYDILPLDSKIFNLNSDVLIHNISDSRSLVLENKLVDLMIEEEQYMDRTDKKISDLSKMVNSKVDELNEIKEKLNQRLVSLNEDVQSLHKSSSSSMMEEENKKANMDLQRMQQNENLGSQYHLLLRDLSEKSSSLKYLEFRNADLMTEKSAIEEKLGQLEKKVEKYNHELHKLELQHHQKLIENQKLVEDNANLISEKQRLLEKIEEEHQEKDKDKEEVVQLSEQIKNLQSELDAQKIRRDKLIANNKIKDEQISNLTARNNELDETNSAILEQNQELESLKEERVYSEERLEQLVNEVASYKEELKQQKERRDKLISENREQDVRMEELLTGIKAKKESIEQLTKKVEELELLKEERVHSEERLEQLVNEVASYKEELKQQKERRDKLISENREQDVRMEELLTGIKAKKESIEQLTKKVEELELLKEERVHSEERLEQLVNEVASYKEELTKQKERKDKLLNESRDNNILIQQLKDKILGLENELKKAAEDLTQKKELKDQYSRIVLEKERLEKELDKVSEEKLLLNSNISKLSEDLNKYQVYKSKFHSIKQKNKRKNKLIRRFEQTLKSFKNKNQRLAKKSKKLKTQLKLENKRFEEIESINLLLEKRELQYKSEIGSLKKLNEKLNFVELANKKLENQLLIEKKRSDKGTSKVAELKTFIRRNEQEILKLSKELNIKEEKFYALKNENEKAKVQCHSLSAENTKLKEKLMETTAIVKNKEKEIKFRKESLRKLSMTLSEYGTNMKQSLIRWHRSSEQLKEEIERLKNKLERSEDANKLAGVHIKKLGNELLQKKTNILLLEEQHRKESNLLNNDINQKTKSISELNQELLNTRNNFETEIAIIKKSVSWKLGYFVTRFFSAPFRWLKIID